MRANGRKRDANALVPGGVRNLVTALHPESAASRLDSSEQSEVAIDELWLDDQPRQIVPDDVLTRLIAENRARPAMLLEELRTIASVIPYFAVVLTHIEELSASIAANGILTPLLVTRKDERLIVRDGHRRTLASLMIGRTTVPVRMIDEPSDVDAVARQLVVNLQREDLTALDKARWVLRLARLVEESLHPEGGPGDARSVVDVLLRGSESEGDGNADDLIWRNLSAGERELSRRVQERVCELTGMRASHYYRLMGLNRLSTEARAAGMGLAEAQLRPVTTLPPEEQAPAVVFIARQGLGGREATTLVKVMRSGDRDAVQRVMARLAREDTGRQRASVSWEPLLHAVPRDLESRCAALFAELKALPEPLRAVRLAAMQEQERLALEMARQFAEMRTLFGDADGAANDSSPHVENGSALSQPKPHSPRGDWDRR